MITIEDIKKLRDMTGAGVNAVREALESSNGNFDEAVKYLRLKGIAKADKRKDKVASNGTLGMYVHSNRFTVIVDVACETDFAANSEDMTKFANDIALHIAAKNPQYINPESVDAEFIRKETEIIEKELEGKPENIKENIKQGKLDKVYEDITLTKQVLFTDENKKVEDYLNELVAKIGEKIEIVRFTVIKFGNPLIVSENKKLND